MTRTYLLCLGMVLGLIPAGSQIAAQEEQQAPIRVVVDMVQLNVAVTDSKGNYISGLHPEDFTVTEDGIKEKPAIFAEGYEPARRLVDAPSAGEKVSLPDSRKSASPPGDPQDLASALAGANVFILFDTSNYMYRGFVFAQDAISDFVRSLDTADQVAFYSYSRDLSRGALLTPDRSQVLRAVRTTVAGDDAALYNCLLLTVKDTALYVGRKVIVVFSNGPDNSSMVPPEDVAELAQSTGTAIYMISTQQARLEPVSTAVFERMTAATGGKAYFAKNWREEKQAFASIRDDLQHLYSLSYYPQPNPNRGWRTITVKLVGERLSKYHIRTRSGYRPQPNRFSGGSALSAAATEVMR
ncbi:MAG TPA: VWA domain-containing protein [Terriglobales bacterium]|nr:VWA domain-containing protein [Terriglobales bacterium]